MQVDWKTVPLLLTQNDISNLFNYRVVEYRFYVTNLILGIVKTSTLSNKRWKSHNVCDSRTGTAVVLRNTETFLSSLIWSQKVTMCKAETWFLSSEEQILHFIIFMTYELASIVYSEVNYS